MFDRRMYAIFDYVAAKLPKTGIGHFTNGTTLRPKNIDRLCALPNLGFINVSLNSHQPKEHTRLMGLKFELVLENLMALHQAFEKRGVTKPVYLTRVGDGTQRDIDFMAWCRLNFPLFTPTCRPRFDWLGKTYAMDTGRVAAFIGNKECPTRVAATSSAQSYEARNCVLRWSGSRFTYKSL
jgi:hypothetical protein